MAAASAASAAPVSVPAPATDEKTVGLDEDVPKLDMKRIVDIVITDHTGVHPNKTITIPIGFAVAESTLLMELYKNLVEENEHLVSRGLPEKPYVIKLTTSSPHGLQWNIIDAIEVYWRIHAGQHPRELAITERQKANKELAGCVPMPLHFKNFGAEENEIPDKRDIPFIVGGTVKITNNDGTTSDIEWKGIKAYGVRLGLVHELADSANYLAMKPLTYMACAAHATNYIGIFDEESQKLLGAVDREKSYEYIYQKDDGYIEEKDYLKEDDKKADTDTATGEAAAAPAAPAAPATTAPTMPAMPATQEDEDAQLAQALHNSTIEDEHDELD